MADYPEALEMLVNRNRVFINARPHSAIVIHKTAGFETAQQVAQFFATDPNEASTHYVVGLDGTVVQCVQEVDGAAGNCCLEAGYDPFWNQFSGNKNLYTFSIEHVDPATDNSTPVTDAQREASFALVRYLVNKYNIPPTSIKPHSSLDPLSRARCPGNYPFSDLVAYVSKSGTAGVPRGWTDDGTTLRSPDGTPIRLGFREFILNFDGGWASNDTPMGPEESSSPVERGYPALGGGTRQFFMYHELGWTSDKGVYLMSVGREAFLFSHP